MEFQFRARNRKLGYIGSLRSMSRSTEIRLLVMFKLQDHTVGSEMHHCIVTGSCRSTTSQPKAIKLIP
jgi:hypothetical protein